MEQRPAGEEAPRVRDFMRAERFVEEFEEMDRNGAVPNFMFMALGESFVDTLKGLGWCAAITFVMCAPMLMAAASERKK